MEERTIGLGELEEIIRDSRYTSMKLALLLKPRRGKHRDLVKTLRLARLAREEAEAYIEVVEWGRAGEERVIVVE